MFYQVLRESMLNSLAKCNEFANLEPVDSEKQLFSPGVYSGNAGPHATTSPNGRPEGRPEGEAGGRGWTGGRETLEALTGASQMRALPIYGLDWGLPNKGFPYIRP